MWPVGWEALEQWGDDVVRSEPLTGGVGVNEVWSVRVNGQPAVGRLGARSDADLEWETELLRGDDASNVYRDVVLPVKLAVDEWYVQRATLWTDVLVVVSLCQRFVFRNSGCAIERRIRSKVPEARLVGSTPSSVAAQS